MLRKMLQGFGLTVDTVDSAEEALNYLRGQRPDAIFMDHTMPGLDGLGAVRQIKREPGIAAIPVTMYTSKDEPAYQDEARAAGAIGVLVKPATPDALGAVLEQMNALFDATAALIASAPPPPLASPAPAGEAVTTEQFEKLAVEKAELVVYDAIESQVLPLINDVIAKVRRDLEAGQEEICGRIAARVCEAQFAKWQPPALDPRDARSATEAALRTQLPPLLEERLEGFRREGRAEIERQAREVAGQIYQSQLHELSERMVRQLSARIYRGHPQGGGGCPRSRARSSPAGHHRDCGCQCRGRKPGAGDRAGVPRSFGRGPNAISSVAFIWRRAVRRRLASELHCWSSSGCVENFFRHSEGQAQNKMPNNRRC
ncbi:MAG: response regulator [Candidatus Moduliflexus flocculans]|nr:response regulator [Candidatus Moduliflexus flocculans]